MPQSCCVSGCTTGRKRKFERNNEKPVLLQVPKDEILFSKWREVIPNLKANSKVCSLHLWDHEVIRFNDIVLKDGSVFKSPTVPHVTGNAVPSRYLQRASSSLESERSKGSGSSPSRSPKQSAPDPDTIITADIHRQEWVEIEDSSLTSSTQVDTISESRESIELESSAPSSSKDTSNLLENSGETLTSTSSGSDSESGSSQGGSSLGSSKSTTNDSSSDSETITPIRGPTQLHFDHGYSKESPFTLERLQETYSQVILPSKTWSAIQYHDNKTAFLHHNENYDTDKAVVFISSLKPDVLFGKINYASPPLIRSKHELEEFLLKIDRLSSCEGASEAGERCKGCLGFVTCNPHNKIKRCGPCKSERRRLQKGKKLKISRDEKRKKLTANYRKQSKRKSKRIKSLRARLNTCISQCQTTSEIDLELILSKIPQEQRELVKNIFMAAKCKSSKGRRYSRDFIYECIVMRIKGHSLYKKLRRDNKLPLPSERTLNKYTKALKPEYGFQDSIFAAIGLKGKDLDPSERHGCLLLDEMQLDAALTYKADICEVHGMVDLGKYTPIEQKNKQGDHGLVLMFQPFKGLWVQTLGAFLSSAAVPGYILRNIIVEAILLMYNQGFSVDIVTTDGAQWNRAMWKLSGVNLTSSSTEHPANTEQRLWFASDFPHLVKTIWNRVVSRRILNLPEGTVKLSHWETVLKHNEKYPIKQCWTIKSDHLKPSNYQKMNVKMAFQFFGENILSSMKFLKEKGIYPELADCGPTIKFIERMSNLIKAMNSKDILNSLSAKPNCPQNKILTDFLGYLENMHEICKVKHPYGPKSKRVAPQGEVPKQKKAKNSDQRIFVGAEDELTSDAFLGLYVTVRATLELVKYLCDDLGFQFLMTRRLNQDALEHFFGDIRTACGSGSHPDPLLFIQLYRLLSLYSLVKPPRGSNVSGGDIFQALVQLHDLEKNNESQDNKEKAINLIDSIVDETCVVETSPEACASYNPEMLSSKIDEAALCLMAGYVSFKMKKIKPANSCTICSESLVCPPSESPKERERLIEIKSRGGLLRPSDVVYAIILQVEQAVNHTISQGEIHTNVFMSILETLRDHAIFPHTGCDEHHKSLTSAIVTFYLNVRMHFLCREVNKETAEKKKKHKNMAKLARLQTTLASAGRDSDVGVGE